MSRIKRTTALPYQSLHSPQERQRWKWEAEQPAQWSDYRRLPADHPLVADDVVAGQANAED